MPNSVYWIWMQKVFGIATARAHFMCTNYPCARELFELVSAGKVELTSTEKRRQKEALELAKQIQEATLKKGVDIITPDCEDYPEFLQQIYSKPLALYVKGDLGCLNSALPISIVGARHPTQYGIAAAERLSCELVKSGCIIVSGLAVGIDSAAHTSALKSGGKTIGVMGCGIDINYPVDSAAIKTAMKNSGAVITEYPLGTRADKGTFPPRNRIIAGISRGVVVIEAGEKSGSLITAQHALDCGRDVFAVPGSIFSHQSDGAHKIIKDGGAKLVMNAKDILEEYPEYLRFVIDKFNKMQEEANASVMPDIPVDISAETKEDPPLKSCISKDSLHRKVNYDQVSPIVKPVQREPLPPNCDDKLDKVYECVSETPKTADVISIQSQVTIGDAMGCLTELEIMGFIQSFPGGFFGLCPKES